MSASGSLSEAVQANALDARPSSQAVELALDLAAAAGDRLRAVVFFGSQRTRAQPDRWSAYDLFVLTRDYRGFYSALGRAGRVRRSAWLLALLNAWLPPNQISLRITSRSGEPLHAKCAVITLERLLRETSPARRDHFCLGRLFQPAQLVYAADAAAADAVLSALVAAHLATYAWVRPWLPESFDAEQYTRTSLRVSLSREVRPEPEGRADALWQAQQAELVATYGVLLRELERAGELRSLERGRFALRRGVSRLERLKVRSYFAWSLVRATARWAKYVVTFQDWLEYIVHKAERHSGRPIELTARERRLPLIFLWPRLIRFLRQKDRPRDAAAPRR